MLGPTFKSHDLTLKNPVFSGNPAKVMGLDLETMFTGKRNELKFSLIILFKYLITVNKSILRSLGSWTSLRTGHDVCIS